MALESCSTLSLEYDERIYFFLARDGQRGSRYRYLVQILTYWEWGGLERHDLDAPEVQLLPIKLLTFNTETETEN